MTPLKMKKKGQVSKIFIFFASFYAFIVIMTLLVSNTFPASINPNCADANAIKASDAPKPNFLTFIASAWDGIAYVFTLGLVEQCDIPDAILWVIGLFNVLFATILVIAGAFLLRGSS